MTIQYDGSGFHGWQVQAEGRTIQGDIETALSIIYPKEQITLFGSGRTDAGVHALSQIAHVELPSRLSASELCQALNGNLEREIRIDSVEEADERSEDYESRGPSGIRRKDSETGNVSEETRRVAVHYGQNSTGPWPQGIQRVNGRRV